jgi:seryl-tRNA synthetase
VVDELVATDDTRRAAIAEFEALRAEQKELGKQISRAQGEERAALLARTKELADLVKKAEAAQGEAAAAFDAAIRQIGNLVAEDVPAGGEDDYVVLETLGSRRDFAAEGFQPRDHLELGQLLGAIDTERGAKVSGSRFYYLTGQGAELELALLNLAMSTALNNGFTPIIPPALVKSAAMEGTGFLGQAAQDVYHLADDDLYLVGTAEVPLAAYHMDEILDADRLPLRYAGYSPSYRREAGSHGKDTRGIFRVHWFDKVEMFVFCAPEEAAAEHQRLLAWEKEFISALEIPFQVLELAGGDLGLSAVRKYDCYGWLPTQDRYREITSTSNCTDFQARRLNIRSRFPSGTGPVATLNGTLCAIPRTIIMILENHQQADGSVRLPEALRPFLGGREALTPLV